MQARSGTPSRASTETPTPTRTDSAEEIAAIVEGRHSVMAEAIPMHGQPFSAVMSLPPLATT